MSGLCIVRIPRSELVNAPSNLDKAFFMEALKEGLRVSHVKINSIKVTWGSKPGENYSSEIYRAVINGDVYSDSKWEELDISLIVKVLTVKAESNFLELANVFIKEKITYFDVLPYLETLSNGDSFAPKCLYTCKNPPTIVFQDLKTEGYEIYERDNQLDWHHSVLVMNQLAKFHAASMVLLKKNPALKNRYQNGLCCKEVINDDCTIYGVLERTLVKLISVCSKWPNFEKITQKLKEYKKNFKGITRRLSETKPNDRFLVINHGDVWINNFMFNYNKEYHQPITMKFVDFQFSFLGSPGCDINMLFNTSLQLNVLIKKRQALLDLYYETLVASLHHMRYDKIPTKRDLMYEVRARELFGFFCLFSYLPIVMFPKSESIENAVDTLNDEEKTRQVLSSLYENERVVSYLQYSLKRFHDLGVLDEY